MLTLHYAPNSRAGRILWLLEELGLEYELNRMDFHPKDLKSDAHRARHPLGRIPVLEDNGEQIWESGAIVQYVLARYTDNALQPAVDAPEFGKYLQWFHYCEGMVMPPINTIVVHTLLLPEERRDAVVLEQAKKLLTRALEPVNENMNGREYLVGDFTAADIMLGHSVFMSRRLGCVTDAMTDLHAYIDRVEARQAFQKMLRA